MKYIFLLCSLLFIETISIAQVAIPNVEVIGRLNIISKLADSSMYIGINAGLNDDRTDNENLFIGILTGVQNTIGNDNVFIGMQSGFANISGSDNTFLGRSSGPGNTTGNDNTFLGRSSGRDNTIGNANTFLGRSAGLSNVGGNDNVFIGRSTGSANTNGHNNTFLGRSAGLINTIGDDNCFVGRWAGVRHKIGDNNTFVGESAGKTDSLGTNNTIIGADADVLNFNLTNSTALGYLATATASNQVIIGNASVTQISGHVNWSTYSDGRYKLDIKEDVPGLEFINNLRPVTYIFDRKAIHNQLHPNKTEVVVTNKKHKETGFIAQEVEALCAKIGYDFDGVIQPQSENDHYKLAYAEFVVPLTKAIQEQQVMILEMQKQITSLKQEIIELMNKK